VSRELERQTISDHFSSVWDIATDGPVAWPNKPFETPKKGQFVVFNIVDRGTVRKSLGREFFKRYFGTLQLDLYNPQDLGTKPSRDIADKLEPIYDNLELAMSNGQMLMFGTPSARTLALNEQRAANLEDNWDRFIFEAPFYRDQHVEPHE
jgi:hypothetical protein